MAYLGRRGASAPLTSADIPDSSITTAKIVDGTVAEGDLAFSTATQAELDAQRTNSSITTLGTVTAGNLSNTAIVYPAGHVIKTTLKGCSDGLTLNNTREVLCTPAQGIDDLSVTAGNKLAIWFMGGNHYTSTNSPYYSTIIIRVTDADGASQYETSVFGSVGSDARFDAITAFAFHTIAASTTSVDIQYGVRGNYISSGYYFYLTPAHYDSGDAAGMRFCVQEIQS